MASEALTERPLHNPTAVGVNADTAPQSRLTSTLEIEEPRNDENIVYPTGPKLWSTMASMAIACFLSGLDITIVAVAVPSITDEFQTISDIGWYSAAYGMTLSAFVFFFGQIYTLFSIKAVFLIGIATFEIGSLVCTLAPSSAVFILGRAISGLGRGAINGGLFKLLRQCFPLSKQAITNSFFGSIQSIGLIIAPTIGGALIDAFSWRACFGVNLPLGVLCLVLTAYGVHEQPRSSDAPVLTLKEKVKKIDYFGTLLAVPAVTCLLMALQWGGTKFGWGSWQIILPLVFCVLLFVAFGYLQYRQGDSALLPPRILKQRSIIAGMWYGACCEGVLAVTEYYMSIYFQGVRGYTPTKAGLLALPMVGGLSIALIISGLGTTWIGYYYPFMLATSVLTPIASGLLTTLNLEEQIAKAVGLLTFLGVAVGLGLQGPQVALQAVLPIEDVSVGGAVITFGSGMGSALWICASATLFQDRLSKEIQNAAPGTNATKLQEAGLSRLSESIGPGRLKSVLSGYENAVVQTLPIQPAPSKEVTVIPTTRIERRASKRSGIIKSACWECRKRKAKCNGQKPVCVNCSKYDRECVYDSVFRESQVRSLRKTNEKLEAELKAARSLLQKVVYGSEQLRTAVSELLEADKQPSEIVWSIRHGDAAEVLGVKESQAPSSSADAALQRGLDCSAGYGPSTILMDNFSTDELGTFTESSPSDGEAYITPESVTTACSTNDPSLPLASDYTSTQIPAECVQGYPPVLQMVVDSGNNISLQSSQSSYPQSSIIPPNGPPINELLMLTHEYGHQRAKPHQTERRSLFFQPLFTHNDYYLATSIARPTPQDIDSTKPAIGSDYGEIPASLSADMQTPILNGYIPTEHTNPAEEQLAANTLRMHPNYKNNFGNLALSNSIKANGYPRYIQDKQIRNIFVPDWAAMTLNTEADPGDMSNAFGDIYQQVTSLLGKGEPVNRVIGEHPNIAALYDPEQFDKSCLLSQWAARMVHSVKCQGYDFTCFASMNIFWYMMRWMISPSPETYAAMPEWIRPTNYQLFTPHISMADFVIWPAFRELVVQLPQFQERMAWLADLSLYIRSMFGTWAAGRLGRRFGNL
ncbi:major facilitator superfamily transporter [Fusarium beomiforme]|uniref:Major facilitator superfamily transporter n=1 Tax=Fusarium beomiforme TaxID=44412 RepID=A0A9P5AH78_9HYPO|nr:major facilitator superfamily transporter [Fusarium beomiforme]